MQIVEDAYHARRKFLNTKGKAFEIGSCKYGAASSFQFSCYKACDDG